MFAIMYINFSMASTINNNKPKFDDGILDQKIIKQNDDAGSKLWINPFKQIFDHVIKFILDHEIIL